MGLETSWPGPGGGTPTLYVRRERLTPRCVEAVNHRSDSRNSRLSDGVEVGVYDPGETVGGHKNTGWMDVLTGITAHRRKDGEYLVFVEEDYKAKFCCIGGSREPSRIHRRVCRHAGVAGGRLRRGHAASFPVTRLLSLLHADADIRVGGVEGNS